MGDGEVSFRGKEANSDAAGPSGGSSTTPTRREPRIQIDDVSVFSAFVSGQLINISRSGLALRTGRRPTVGRRYPFHLKYGDLRVDVLGVVRWCVLKKTEKLDNGDVVPIYEAGFSIEEGDLDGLAKLVANAQVIEGSIG